MDSQKNMKPKLIFHYVFKDHIERIWECFKSPEILANSVKPQAKKMTVTKGSDYSEIGTTVEFFWKDEIYSEFQITEVVNTKYYKMNKLYSTKLEPLDFKYSYINHFYWNTSDHSTLYKNELIFDDVDALKIIDFKFNKQEKLEYCRYIENYLSNKIDNLYQFESILINVELDSLWEVIKDWRIFQRKVPFIAEEIQHEGDPLQIGSIIHVSHHSKNSRYSLRVIRVEDQEDKKELELELYDSQPNCPKQVLKFGLLAVNKNHTLLSFKHEFKEMIKYILINSIAEEKKNILSDLKKNMEKNI